MPCRGADARKPTCTEIFASFWLWKKLQTDETSATDDMRPHTTGVLPPKVVRIPPCYLFCVGLIGELLGLGSMARHGNFLVTGEPLIFAIFAGFSGMMFWLAAVGFIRAKLPGKTAGRWFWLAAVACRVVIFSVPPGDDLWRYRWEGIVQLHGFNPYTLAPDAPALVPLRNAEWPQISHQNFPAIYPPLAEGTFAAMARVGLPALGDKILFALADLGIVGILRGLLARRGRSADAVGTPGIRSRST